MNSNSSPRIIKSNNTSSQACAACKYQRRKCEPNCILSPYFPHNRQPQFLNAHKLFGVSNITKIIRNLSPANKDEAMKTIIFESDVRANDPVGGCCRIIKELQFMIECYQAELNLVLHQLSVCRAQQAHQAQTKDQQENNEQQRYLQLQHLQLGGNNNHGEEENNARSGGLVEYFDQACIC
ncbi:unnamed protein product [Rhodiola kirilowii]